MSRDEGARPARVLGGVLVGGASSRMGVPKAALAWQGRTLLDVAVASLEPVVQEVLLLGEPPPDVLELPVTDGLRRIPDVAGVEGPLAGALAALRAEPRAIWIVTACDHPWASPESSRWLLAERHDDAHVVMGRARDGRPEPMPALFHPRSLPLLEAMVERREWAPRALADHPHVLTRRIPETLRRAWISVNTPEEYERLLAEP